MNKSFQSKVKELVESVNLIYKFNYFYFVTVYCEIVSSLATRQ